MEFSREEYWSGLSCPPPGDLSNPEIEPGSPMSPALQAGSLPLASPGKSKVKALVTSDSPWTIVAHQASLSMGFPREEYWSVLPVPSPGDLPDPGIKPRSPALQADSLLSEPPQKPSCM